MGNNKFEIGSKVTIELENKEQYLSTIQNIDDDDHFIYVNQLSKEGNSFIPQRDTRIKVNVHTKTCGYVFYGIICDYVTIDTINTMKIERTGIINKVQRRESFRLAHSVPVDIKIYGLYNLNEVETRTTIMCADISEGGIGIHWNEPLEVDRFIDFGINIDGQYYILRCRVARCVQEDDERYRVGLEIINADEHYKDKIRKFIFEAQTK